MRKNRLTLKEYFQNMTVKPKGIKLLLIILALIIVLPLTFGLSFLSLKTNNDLVYESVKNYKHSQTDILKSELKYDMDIIIDMLDSYHKKQQSNNLNQQSAQQLSINMLSTHNMSSASAIYWIESNNKQLITSNLTTDNQITNRDKLQDAYGEFYVNKIFDDLESMEYTYNNFYFKDVQNDEINEYTTYSVIYKPWNWIVTVGASSQEINDTVSSHEDTLRRISKEKTIRMFVVGLIFGLIVLGISSYLGMTIAVNANKILNITNLMKTGDLSHRLKLYSKDELEETADSLNIALDQISNLIKGINDISSTLDTSVTNFTHNQSRMNSTIENVSSAIINITENVNEQAQSTSQVSSNINGISSSIQTTVNELNILENNSNTMINYSNRSSESLQELLKISNRTKKDLDKMVIHTSLTNDSVSKISTAAGLINDIAEQTNLLSLNASIEAARAGEQGKGFAIVASEIGVLAAQSAKTVTEINSILEELNTNSSKSLEIMNEMTSASSIQNETLMDTSNIFNELKTALDTCALSIKNIALKINEIDTQKESIINNVSKLNTLSENNAAYTEETSAMTEELTSSVKHSSRDIANLANEFDTLKENLKKFTI